ncbi:hypothetical protein HAZT_HAZT004228 [Hyalella azteca]|uniref:Peptidase S1 domain-containing protein n=1 Tax=Hyalella azteca TaxID=294128 RepID=A0A6A0GYW3_HYAAZ|nr:hypothetical protein HAZT_HAZT004228 [Hyalella azteca]
MVDKTCWATTSAHSVTFQNPSFPKPNEEAVLCPLTVELGRAVCAVRVDLNVLELAQYEDGVCIRDTLTLLGSTEGIATPVCGNMTGYSSWDPNYVILFFMRAIATFLVKELGKVTVSLVAQSTHRFSITVTQLGCAAIPKFISPTYSGVRNEDAVLYNPPPEPAVDKPTIILRNDSKTNETETTTFNPVVRDDEGEGGPTTTAPRADEGKKDDDEGEDEFHEVNATVTGWGRYSLTTKKTSPYLKEYTGPIQDAGECAKAWKNAKVTAYTDKHICLGIDKGTPCHGDSGGPLVACNFNSCTQVGVVSFGFPLCTNVGLPAVFTRLTYYRPWLDSNMASLSAIPV